MAVVVILKKIVTNPVFLAVITAALHEFAKVLARKKGG
jgi:hypothetical protein